MKNLLSIFLAITVLLGLSMPALAQDSHYDQLTNTPFKGGYPSKESVAEFKDELLFERGVQAYLWALPALNMYAMKEGSEKVFGGGYNVGDVGLPGPDKGKGAKYLLLAPDYK